MSRKESKRVVTTARQRRESTLKPNAKISALTSQGGTARRRRRNTRRLSPLWFIGGLIACVIIVVSVFIYIADHQTAAGVIGPTDPEVLSKVTHVNQSVITKVNTGGLQNQKIFYTTGSAQALTGQDGKPELFYYGGEFCPYCAGQRWPLVVALSRFGTFTKLPQELSSAQDVAPNTSTFTFMGSQYTSPYIDFVPVEAQDRNHKTLQVPAPHEQQVLVQYNVTGFPFIDIANRYVASSPVFDPTLLQGLSQKAIANKLSDPNDNVTKNIVGGANYITAAICSVTQNQPANVCTQAPIPSIEPSVMHSSRLVLPQADVPTSNPMALASKRRENDASA
jgi:hypothetical protein